MTVVCQCGSSKAPRRPPAACVTCVSPDSALFEERGLKITREYAGLYSFEMTASDKWQVCPTVLVAMGDAWKRTIFSFKVFCVDVFATTDDDSMGV